jgi:hypothetical protein
MKVALQLSGRLKFSNDSLGSLISAIIDVAKPDIFCSFWYPEKESTSTIFEKNINSVLCEYEDHSLIRPYLDKLFDSKKIYFNLPVMAYKFHRASMIRQMHERATNTTYDVVIQTRTDVVFFEKLNYILLQESLDKQAILCSNFFIPYVDTFIKPSMRDQFYFGPSKLMDLANSEFWHLLNTIEFYEGRNLPHHISCTEIIQSKIWQNLKINVQPLKGNNLCGSYFQGHFAYDVDRRPTDFT